MEKRKELLVFGKPDIRQEEIEEVIDTLKSGWIGTGKKTERFEKEFAEYIGVNYARAVSSCTAALHLSLISSGIASGDQIITSPLTFGATANVIHHVGARPVFVDVERSSMNLDVKKIRRKLTGRTKAILPVHFTGHPCDMERIMKLAEGEELKVIEDAAHAFGAEYRGAKIGSLGNLTCFSFYPTKNITTIEGGMITTNDEDLAGRIRVLSNHGLSSDAHRRFAGGRNLDYGIVEPGFKYNMTDVQASLGLHQLRRYAENLERRKQIWEKYNGAFIDLPLATPEDPKEGKHAYHLYTILLDLKHLKIDREGFREALFQEKIGTGVHYKALHLHSFYSRTYNYKKGDFPNAEYISERTVSLPLSSALCDGDVEDVINAVRRVCNRYEK